MADPVPSSNRLEDLQMRWQLDPGSRVYLQLAEEYRRLERHPEAIEVLRRGLEQRPNDLSGQVALGRCHLEMDELEPAVKLLEGVIERDPAHMVGTKLLLEAYLKAGDAARAGERLDLYKLLNPADPELDSLEAQLRSLRAAPPGIPEPHGVTTAEIPIVPRDEEEPEPVEEEPPARDPAFETSPTLELPVMNGGAADEPPPPAVEEPPLIDEALIGGASNHATPPQQEPAYELVLDPGPPGPVRPAVGMREPVAAMALASSELFELGPPPPPPRFEELWGWPAAPALTEALPAAEPLLDEPQLEEPQLEEPWLQEPLLEEPQLEEPWLREPLLEEPQLDEPLLEEPVLEAEEAVAPEPVAPEPAPEEPPAPQEPATATLGALYLRQGHVAEAEKIFRQVLRRDPRNAAALAGLARIRGETGLTAQALLASAGERVPVGLTAKKIRLLESYMKHLRNASKSHHVH